MKRSLRASGLALSLLCVVAPAQEDPLRVWKRESSFHTRLAKALLKAQCQATGEQLGGLVEGLRKGAIQPQEIADRIGTIANDASAAIDAIVEQEVRVIESFTSSAISQPPVSPLLIVGACELVEKLMAAMNKLQLKAIQSTLKDIKKAIKFIERLTGHKVAIVLVPPMPVPPPAPAPAVPVPPPPKPITLRSMAAGSDVNATNDGKLCVGGTANPAVNGGMINVAITGPGGTTMQTVAVDPVTCKWKACFPAMGAGNLPEGNYRVAVDQGAATVRGTIGVPG